MFICNKRFYVLLSACTFMMLSIYADVPCFFIEGPTGVGKTTFVELLGRSIPDVTIMHEPVETFVDVHGTGNLLDLFFKDQKRWAFTAEVYITLMHMKAVEKHAKNSQASVAIIDRSMYADCFVFGKMGYTAGTMSTIEWVMYKELFDWIVKNTTVKPHGFIYLKASPDIALDRVKNRQRTEEKDLSMQFEEDLHRCYTEWFIEKKDIPAELANIPLLIIDANQNFKDDPIIQQHCIDQVKAFIARSI